MSRNVTFIVYGVKWKHISLYDNKH